MQMSWILSSSEVKNGQKATSSLSASRPQEQRTASAAVPGAQLWMNKRRTLWLLPSAPPSNLRPRPSFSSWRRTSVTTSSMWSLVAAGPPIFKLMLAGCWLSMGRTRPIQFPLRYGGRFKKNISFPLSDWYFIILVCLILVSHLEICLISTIEWIEK